MSHPLLSRLSRRFPLETQHRLDRAVLLAGSGRSGTTWVAELMGQVFPFRLMFEPFFAARVPLCEPFAPRTYLPPDHDALRYLLPAQRILSGRVRHPWIDAHNPVWLASRRLIKDIRVNLLLPWLQQQFPTVPLLWLLRHPFAVVHSRLKLGWQDHINDLLAQPMLLQVLTEAETRQMREADTPFERHLLLWLVENTVPLRLLPPGSYFPLFYEALLQEPEAGMQPLCTFLGLEPPAASLATASRRRSATDWLDGASRRLSRSHSWSQALAADDLQRGLDRLAQWGWTGVYADQPQPLVPASHLTQVVLS
jgi:hypothetical protein